MGVWQKLRSLKPKIKDWQKQEVGNTSERITQIERELTNLNQGFLSSNNGQNFRVELITMKAKLWNLYRI